MKGFLAASVFPLAILIVGLAFVPLAYFRFPVFWAVALLYVFIGLRGLFLARRDWSGVRLSENTGVRSDKAQLESL